MNISYPPVDRRTARSLLTVAAVAALVDCIVFVLATAGGLRLEGANALSFAAALAVAGVGFTRASGRLRPGSAFVLATLAFVMQAGVLSLLVRHAGLSAMVAIVPAAVAGWVVLLAGAGFLLLAPTDASPDAGARWAGASVLTVVYLLALRLVYLGQLELMPQEAYYWNFARHLDLGYLDHPPLVAWLIAATTFAADNEWLVRLPAVVCSLVTMGFAGALARDLAGRSTALPAALLAAALPFFFGVGIVMTPDAPLTAAWAGALYYLNRALLAERRGAWIGAGVAIGIGMLSKYTMVLVPLGALAFVLVDSRARRTLRTPWPWLGAIVALLVFSPVVIWNMQHDWASFTFQGARRLAPQAKTFGLHMFVLFFFALVTPWGIAGFVRGLTRKTVTGRPLLFAAVFTLVPLVPLAVTSIWTETKFHWTGPIWLAALPLIATSLVLSPAAQLPRRFDRWLARTWPAVLSVLLVVYALVLFYYPVYGLAGIHAHHRYIATGWRDLRAQVQRIEDDVTSETGSRPAIVGLDRNNMASEMAYYAPRGDGPSTTAGLNVVEDADALMYEFWFSPRDFAGRNLIVVSCDRKAVEDPRLPPQAKRAGPVLAIAVHKDGIRRKDCYARVLYDFTPAPRQPRR